MAKKDMRHLIANLPDKDLAYFSEGTEHLGDYVEAVEWAQDFAMTNHRLMMDAVIRGAIGPTNLGVISAFLGVGFTVSPAGEHGAVTVEVAG